MKILLGMIFIVLSAYCKSDPPELIYLPKDSIKKNEIVSTDKLLMNDFLEIVRYIWFDYTSTVNTVSKKLENLVPKKKPESPPRIILRFKN